MDNVKLRDYLKSNKEILNSRSKTEGILLDYYGGNQQIVKRLMKGYDCRVVSIFLNNEIDEIKKDNFIGRLVREEDLIENVARDIYNEWQGILTDGNDKQLIKGEADNKNSKEKTDPATISKKTKNSPITLSNTSIKKKQVTVQKKKQKNKSQKKGNPLYNGNKQKDKSDSKRVDPKNDLTQLYTINKTDSDKVIFLKSMGNKLNNSYTFVLIRFLALFSLCLPFGMIIKNFISKDVTFILLGIYLCGLMFFALFKTADLKINSLMAAIVLAILFYVPLNIFKFMVEIDDSFESYSFPINTFPLIIFVIGFFLFRIRFIKFDIDQMIKMDTRLNVIKELIWRFLSYYLAFPCFLYWTSRILRRIIRFNYFYILNDNTLKFAITSFVIYCSHFICVRFFAKD